MDFLERIKDLAARGVTIDFQHDHYKDGINCNWCIRFEDRDDLRGRPRKTMWHGDDHEFGPPDKSMKAAVDFAYFLLENEDLRACYFELGRYDNQESRDKISAFLQSLHA